MENAEVIEQNDSWSNDLNDSDLHGIRKEVSSASIYGNGLESPILGSSFRVPDIPKRYIEPIALDTSLPYIPVYMHLKTYDLKSIERPSTPPILTELRLKCQNDAESCKSSKALPSSRRSSKERSSISLKPREAK
ncbi:uncharacterized protein LOC105680272 [Bombus impatiens]|uniref:Uncharacterized protein LOC105680272 n=1 Tax=Bombus impatiens TaxID=132113 RepID=A0A6P3ULD3_BOMIM|nr:uncharacterized protein LOC105680272 [Bombus impatiens]XP_033174722.1 uncharacterized protein LOC105680272 [Bombus impatiens]